MMLVAVTGSEIQERKDLLEQCYIQFQQVEELRVVYTMQPNKSSILEVQFAGKFASIFVLNIFCPTTDFI
jgi:hypothetical protein